MQIAVRDRARLIFSILNTQDQLKRALCFCSDVYPHVTWSFYIQFVPKVNWQSPCGLILALKLIRHLKMFPVVN